MIQKNQSYPAEIIGITNEGNGVAKIDGMTVFVPLTAVGDRAMIRILKVNKSYCYGKVDTLLTPSPDRIEVDCPAFSQCGGCAYRHINYQAELAVKQQSVQDAFERLAKIRTQHLPILPSERVDHYRNKAQFPVGMDSLGKAFAGFYANRSHRIISCDNCRLQIPSFDLIKQAVLDYLNQYEIPPYDEASGQGVVRHIYIRHAEQTDAWMVALVVTDTDLPCLEKLAETLRRMVDGPLSLLLNINRENTNVILGKEILPIVGNPDIIDILCEKEIVISPLSFYQVNRCQAERLYRIAAEFAGFTGSEILVDLYCGAGTIGLSMASQVKQLIGVEVIPEAVENARENARRNGCENATFLCADAAEATVQLRQEGIRPDVVIVDPPRKGCAPSVLSDIAEMSPERIVMISCNPATAARDCAILSEYGYCTEKVQPVDLFPRTTHVECVCLLIKGENPD